MILITQYKVNCKIKKQVKAIKYTNKRKNI